MDDLIACALRCGKARSSGSPGARAFLETRLLSMYAATNEEGREFLAAIVERGRVHV